MSINGKQSLEGSMNQQGGASGEIFIGHLVGPQGPPGPRGPQGPQGKDGEDYVITEEDKLEIAGLVLNTETLRQLQNDVADLKYVPIDITGISNSVGTVEIGSVVDEVTIRWSVNKQPTSQTFDGENVDVSLREKTITDMALRTNKPFAVGVTDERGATDVANTVIYFFNRVYYGAAAIPEILDSEFVLGLSNSVLTPTKGRIITVNASGDQYIWYALPITLGTCTFTVGGFEGGFTLVDTIAFTNTYGHEESYYIYRSSNIVPGETKVVIS